MRAPAYGTDADFAATTNSALTASQSNAINGSFATDSITIDTLKIDGGHTLTLNAAQTLTIRTGAANTDGAILQTGGNSTITGGTGITTGGSGSLTFYVNDVNGSPNTLTLDSILTSGTTGGITKSGAGTLVLSQVNAQTGTTSINEGTVRLSGTGTLNTAVTVGSNAIHSPGNSPGAQTFPGNLTSEAGALVNWELIANTTGSAGVNYDQIIMPTGNLTFSGSTTLALSFDSFGSSVDWSDSFWNVNHAWTVYDLSGGTTTSFSNLSLGGSLLDSVGNSLSPTERGYFTTSLSGEDVMLHFVAVPEPATLAMLVAVGIASAPYAMRRQRSRRHSL
jgi:autotransporter-associated beta strand protein